MGWAEDARRQREEQYRKMALQVAREQQYDPQVASRVFHVAERTNLPQSVVAADLDNLESRLKKNEFNFDDYTDEKNGSPIFNKFAAENPYNYAILERDREHMNRVEKTVNSMYLSAKAGWAMGEMGDLMTRYVDGNEKPEDQERRKELSQLISGGHFGAGKYAKLLTGFSKQAALFAHTTVDSADEALAAGIAGGTAALIAGNIGPQALVPEEAITIPVTATTAAAVGFAGGRAKETFEVERGLALDQYLEMGFDREDAIPLANFVGAVNAPLEYLGFSALTKRVPGYEKLMKNKTDEIVRKIFDQPKFSNAAARFTVAYGEGVGVELVTEILQESTTMAGQEYLKHLARAAGDDSPEMAKMRPSEFYDSLGDIIVETLYGVALMGAGGPAMQLRADTKRVRNAQMQQEQWKALGEATDGAESRTDGSGAWQEFVRRVKEKGPLSEVRVDSEGWRNYWQSKEIDPNEAAEQLGVDISEMELGNDVVIPFDTFIDKVAATEHLSGLMADLRVREDEFTLREAEKWVKEKESHIQRAEAALKNELGMELSQEVYEAVKGDLVGQYNEKAAEVQAKMTALIFTTTAARMKMDPMELYNQRLKGTKGDVPASLQKGDFNPDIDPLLDRIRNKDFPRQRDILSGGTLVDLMREMGVKDDGGELASRDFGKQFIGVISNEGVSLDAVAEVATERGFIEERDENLLLEAIDRELAGEPVFSRLAKVDEAMQRTLDLMQEAEVFLEAEGIDLDNMSNQEIREKLEGIKRFEQTDENDIDALRAMIATAVSRDPAMLAQIMRNIPRAATEQDFSSITFTDKFVDTNGKTGTAEINAQVAYDNASNDRNILNRLLDCVSG